MSSEPVTRKCRWTGAQITVCRAEDAGFDPNEDPELRWYTVCDTHGYLVGHRTKTLALSHATAPEWCEDCQKIMETKR